MADRQELDPALLDDLGFLVELRRGLQQDRKRELQRAPGFADQIDRRYALELEAVNAAIRDAADVQRTDNYWMEREATDPIAAGLVRMLLAAKSDSEIFEIAQDIAGRFRSAANPDTGPEPEPAELVADVDHNNPAPREAPPVPAPGHEPPQDKRKPGEWEINRDGADPLQQKRLADELFEARRVEYAKQDRKANSRPWDGGRRLDKWRERLNPFVRHEGTQRVMDAASSLAATEDTNG